LRHGEHAVVTDAPGDLAAGLAHLLTDADYWQRLADAGHALASATHDPERVRERFLGVVDEVVELPPRHGVGGVGMRRVRRREAAYRETVGAVAETLAGVT